MFHGGANIFCSLYGNHDGAEEKCEKEGAAERNSYVLTITLYSLALLEGTRRGVCGEGVKLNMEEGRGQVF